MNEKGDFKITEAKKGALREKKGGGRGKRHDGKESRRDELGPRRARTQGGWI